MKGIVSSKSHLRLVGAAMPVPKILAIWSFGEMYQKLPNEERPVVETEPRDLSYFRICDQVGYSAAHDS